MPGLASHAHDAADVDPLVLERPQGKVIGADTGDEAHLGAKARRGQRLVGALPSRDPFKFRVGHGLTGPREPRAPGDEVDVGRSDDGDARCASHEGYGYSRRLTAAANGRGSAVEGAERMRHRAELPVAEHGGDHRFDDVRTGLAERPPQLGEQLLGRVDTDRRYAEATCELDEVDVRAAEVELGTSPSVRRPSRRRGRARR